MKIECKKCGEEIYVEYDPISAINMPFKFSSLFKKKKLDIKYFSELNSKPTETCHTSVYLTCGNNHTDHYFCKIDKL